MQEVLEKYRKQHRKVYSIARIMEYVLQRSTRDWNEDLLTAYPLETLLSLPDQKLQELFLEAKTYLSEHEPRHIGETERFIESLREKE